MLQSADGKDGGIESMKVAGPNLTGTEIVELSIQIEQNGRDFYSGLADRLKNKQAQELFRFMAEQEAQHMEDFKNILASVRRHEPPESYPQEYFSYMRAIAGQYLFAENDEIKERTANVDTEKEAIDVSLGFEKDSILLYQEMKRMIAEDDRRLIDEIITQEKDHISKLWALRTRL